MAYIHQVDPHSICSVLQQTASAFLASADHFASVDDTRPGDASGELLEATLTESGTPQLRTTDALRKFFTAYDVAMQQIGKGKVSDVDKMKLNLTGELLYQLTKAVQGTVQSLQEAIDNYQLPLVPDFCKEEPSKDRARRLLVYAHKLSYTTFAPPGFIPGQTPLRNFRPPAPQDWQLMNSQLHDFAATYEQLKSGKSAVKVEEEQEPVVPMLLNKIDIPPMPPGWKPGDPIPGLAQLLAAREPALAAQLPPAPASPATVTTPPPQPTPPSVPDIGGAFNFVLNADLVNEEEYSDYSDEYSDEE